MKSVDIATLEDASIKIIIDGQFDSGGYIASPNFSVYNYSWFRDGAFIADAMADSGQIESASNFHEWASRVILDRKNKIDELLKKSKRGIQISPDEHLHCRFTLEGQDSQSEWTNFQLDGYGTWIWSLVRFAQMGHPVSEEAIQASEVLIPYLIEFWAEPSFDWWEESFGHQHVSSLGCIAAGLRDAANWAQISNELRARANQASIEITAMILNRGLSKESSLRKWLDDDGLDASTLALIEPLKLFPANSTIGRSTLESVKNSLGIYGTHRHLNDVYYGGGLWLLLSAFLGLACLSNGDKKTAEDILSWLAAQADERNFLPEQIELDLLFPESRPIWIAKWGEPANPLLWSHAMFLKLSQALKDFGGQNAEA